MVIFPSLRSRVGKDGSKRQREDNTRDVHSEVIQLLASDPNITDIDPLDTTYSRYFNTKDLDTLKELSLKEIIILYKYNRIPQVIGDDKSLLNIGSYRPYFYSLSSADRAYTSFFRLLTLTFIDEAIKEDDKVASLKPLMPCLEYYSGYLLGLNISKYYHIDSLDALAYILHRLKLGLLDIVHEAEDKIIADIYECIICSGIPKIGRAVCDFSRGLLAATVGKIRRAQVKVKEVKCWGLGDTKCEFVITIDRRRKLI